MDEAGLGGDGEEVAAVAAGLHIGHMLGEVPPVQKEPVEPLSEPRNPFQ